MDILYSDRSGTTHCVITEIIKAKTTKEAFKNERNKDSNIGLSTSSRERKKKKKERAGFREKTRVCRQGLRLSVC